MASPSLSSPEASPAARKSQRLSAALRTATPAERILALLCRSAAQRSRSRRGPRTQLLLGFLAGRGGAPTDEPLPPGAWPSARLPSLGCAWLRKMASAGVSATRKAVESSRRKNPGPPRAAEPFFAVAAPQAGAASPAGSGRLALCDAIACAGTRGAMNSAANRAESSPFRWIHTQSAKSALGTLSRTIGSAYEYFLPVRIIKVWSDRHSARV